MVSYARQMSTPEVSPRGNRETRLLLVTIAISVGVLLLLARFRFPVNSDVASAEPAPAPLERLAARAAYDDLASVMADLERRVTPRVVVVRTQSGDGRAALVIGPRMAADRAAAIIGPDHTVLSSGNAEPQLVDRDERSGVAVLQVPALEDGAVQIRPLPLRTGPRYVGVLEATAIGPALRPVYVGRVESVDDPRASTPLLAFAGLQREVPAGAAIFSLEGVLLGLVRESGDTLTLVPGEALRAAAQSATANHSPPATLGIEVDSLTASLARATGADRGVVVVHVAPHGPADGIVRTGDVLQSLGDVAISSPAVFRDALRGLPPDRPAAITGVRSGAPLRVSVTAANAPATIAPADALGLIGRDVRNVGVEVMAVDDGSAAARAGLLRGDLIVAVNGERTDRASDVLREYRSKSPAVLLTIQRGNQHRVLPLEKR